MARKIGVVIDPLELDENWVRRVQDGGIQLLGLHPNPKDSSPEGIAAWYAEAENARLLEKLRASGVQIEWEVHALSWLLPRSLFETHPEYFRMNEEGQRTPDHNLCCSNGAALEELRRNAASLASLMPSDTHRYHFWLDDVSQCRCRCPQCESLTAADQALTVYNAILEGIRRTDPAAKQCYLAYHDTNAVPASVRPAEGIYLEYAPFMRDHRKPLTDPDSPQNAAEIKALPKLLEYFGLEDAQALDYWLDNSLFSGWKKPPKEFHLERDVLREDAENYRKLGFGWITTFACYLGKDYTDLYPEPEDTVLYGKILSEE